MRQILVVLTLSIFAACGGSDGPTDPGGNNNPPGGNGGGGNEPPPAERTVQLTATSFSPSNATVAVGGRVTWQDGSGVAHTITPQNHSQWTRVETTGSGQPLQVTFSSAGSYSYFCEIHAGMNGQITVQ